MIEGGCVPIGKRVLLEMRTSRTGRSCVLCLCDIALDAIAHELYSSKLSFILGILMLFRSVTHGRVSNTPVVK